MPRRVLHVLLLIALVLQGAMAFAGDFNTGLSTQHHCAGHNSQKERCPCCAGESNAGVACTVQCSAVHVTHQISIPRHVSESDVVARVSDRSTDGPAYAPLVPPPIR